MSGLSGLPADWCQVNLKKWENPDEPSMGYVKDRRSPSLQDDYELRYFASPEGKLFVPDSRGDVRMKHVAIVLFSPLIFVAKMIFRIGRFLAQVGVNLVHGRLWEMFKGGAKALRDIIFTPFLWVAMVACSIYGWADPFGGRLGVGAIENFENQKISFKDSCLESRGGLADCSALTNDEGAFYIAPCMQVRGNLHDGKFDVVKWVKV